MISMHNEKTNETRDRKKTNNCRMMTHELIKENYGMVAEYEFCRF